MSPSIKSDLFGNVKVDLPKVEGTEEETDTQDRTDEESESSVEDALKSLPGAHPVRAKRALAILATLREWDAGEFGTFHLHYTVVPPNPGVMFLDQPTLTCLKSHGLSERVVVQAAADLDEAGLAKLGVELSPKEWNETAVYVPCLRQIAET